MRIGKKKHRIVQTIAAGGASNREIADRQSTRSVAVSAQRAQYPCLAVNPKILICDEANQCVDVTDRCRS